MTRNTDVQELRRQLAALKAEVDRLTQELADLRAASTRAEEEYLKTIAELRANAHAPEDLNALHAAEAETLRLKERLKTCRTEKQDLQTTITNLRAEIARIQSDLAATVKQTASSLGELKQSISRNVQREITAAELLEKLIAKKYTDIRDAVLSRVHRTHRKTYSTAAAFLHVESMGATWCMYQVNEAKILQLTALDRDQIKACDDQRLLVLEQMLYDLTLYYTMHNETKTRYANKHVTVFIKAFKLTEESPDGEAANSTDDEP
jgi:DNA repair exonuclease SbcCD ATPase subunit